MGIGTIGRLKSLCGKLDQDVCGRMLGGPGRLAAVVAGWLPPSPETLTPTDNGCQMLLNRPQYFLRSRIIDGAASTPRVNTNCVMQPT